MFKRGMLKISSYLLAFLLMMTVWVNPDTVSAQSGTEKIGILVVAHGSSEDTWNQPVRDAVEDVETPFPVEAGFLESVPGEDIPAAVAKLEQQGVNHIIAVPIFVASASGHIEEIKYMLGIDSSITADEAAEEGLEVISHSSEIEMTPALDDHMLVAEILADRIETVSRKADQEAVVLAAHGTKDAEELAVWKNNLESLGDQLKEIYGFLDVDYGFVALGEPKLRDAVQTQQAIYTEASIIVMPMMLSEGTFTSTKIPASLDGLTYTYPEAGQRSLLPHDNIAKIISFRVNDAVLGSIKVTGKGKANEIAYSDVALEEEGKICICGSFTYRAMQAAIASLWPDKTPDQEDMLVEGPYSDGVENALKIIAGDGHYSLSQREQNTSFYNFKVTNKENGKSVQINVKKDVYPESFFELKKKVKAGTATSYEKQTFQSKRTQLAEKLRWNDAESLFDLEIIAQKGKSKDRSHGGINADIGNSGNIVTENEGESETNHSGDSKRHIKLTIGNAVSNINGQMRNLEVAPYLSNNRTMVPLRFIAEGMGATVEWVGESRTVIIKQGDKELHLVIGATEPGMDVPPVIVKGHTMVPLRYISEALGAEVKWNQETQQIEIVY